MATLLLVVIFAAYISMGLPDTLLGSAWPVMQLDLGLPLSAGGALSMLATGGTILSSLFSSRLIARFGTGKVTLFSTLITAVALLGYALVPQAWWLFPLSLVLGLGGGAIDAALNNYVALHFRARHITWLHSFWGVGAITGPLIMSLFLTGEGGWRQGYLTICLVQTGAAVALFLAQPLFGRFAALSNAETVTTRKTPLFRLIGVPGAKPAMLSYFCYCTAETTIGLWGSSFLVATRGVGADTAAQWLSLFFVGITLGRFVAGIISERLGGQRVIWAGMTILAAGIVLLALPLPAGACIPGFLMLGLGCAPIYPLMLHDTPKKFGPSRSQGLMGLQMATASLGSTIMSPVFGLLATWLGTGIFPYFLALSLVLLFVLNNWGRRYLKNPPPEDEAPQADARQEIQ